MAHRPCCRQLPTSADALAAAGCAAPDSLATQAEFKRAVAAATAAAASLQGGITPAPCEDAEEQWGVVCRGCGAASARCFVQDVEQGDVVCTRCGAVALEHMLNDTDCAATGFVDAEDGDGGAADFFARPGKWSRFLSDGAELGTGWAGRRLAHRVPPVRDQDKLATFAAIVAAAAKMPGTGTMAVEVAVATFAKLRTAKSALRGSRPLLVAACLYAAAHSVAARTPLLLLPREDSTPTPAPAPAPPLPAPRRRRCIDTLPMQPADLESQVTAAAAAALRCMKPAPKCRPP